MSLNEILTMHEDLDRALQKAPGERSWVMVIDLRKCVGCHACSVACTAENVCPPGSSFRRVFDEYDDAETFAELDRFFMPGNCQQCENAPCLKAANAVVEGCVTQRPDGIIRFDAEKLAKSAAARAAALDACPYEAAIVEDAGAYATAGTPHLAPYETRTFYEEGRELRRTGKENTIRKCGFCLHRIESRMLPACVSTCIGRAMYFGDRSDKKSLVSQLIAREKTVRLTKDDTRTRIHYIGYATRSAIAVPDDESCSDCH